MIAEHRISCLKEVADRYLYMEEGKVCKQYSALESAIMPDSERFLKSFSLLFIFSNTVSPSTDIVPLSGFNMPASIFRKDYAVQYRKALMQAINTCCEYRFDMDKVRVFI